MASAPRCPNQYGMHVADAESAGGDVMLPAFESQWVTTSARTASALPDLPVREMAGQ